MILLGNCIDKTYGVLGLSRTGLAALHSFLLSNARVVAWDDNPAVLQNLKDRIDHPKGALDFVVAQAYLDGRLKLMSEPVSVMGKLAGLVVSPGIAIQYQKVHATVAIARQFKVPLLSDIELLQSACQQARYIGITGTNGKSTTTALVGHIYKSSNRRAQVGGNIGIPVLSLDPMVEDGTYIVELSSFQLEIGNPLQLDVAVLINITPDHLDRYPSMKEYVDAKMRVFAASNRTKAVISIDYPITAEIADKLLSQGYRVIPISTKKQVPGGISVIEGVLLDSIEKETISYMLPALPNLRGRHNSENLAAAYAACRAGGLSHQSILGALPNFIGLPHRMQIVGEKDMLCFINDSKATNIDSARCSLEAFDNIIWIAGGVCKDEGIKAVADLFPKLRYVYLIGEAAVQFAAVLQEYKVPHTIAGTLAKAMSLIGESHYKAGNVLLAPACASLDQWKNFEERGEAFCKMAKEQFLS
ncbi:MAG: UDP-N-acetylmuramoyl-L-alanine--D-glutamate ligase [Proteobacteria bacterium]|nr:UDP-N-acetylmuramoyl-L-alanine--D-glutamate ligase [Pseudomonadota bacterium]